MRRWMDKAANTLVMDATRPVAAPSDTNLSTGYATGDLMAQAADAWIKTRTRNTWRMIYVIWGLLPVGGMVWYREWELDGWVVLGVCGAVFALSYVLGWWNEEEVTHQAWTLFEKRYQGVTAKITEPPPAAAPGRVVAVESDPLPDWQRLEMELRYVLMRAVHTPRSLRDNEYEVIPGVNVRLDKELYRFLMYILRELKLVSGGRDSRTGRRKAWRCNFASTEAALTAFEACKHKLRDLNMRSIKEQADAGDTDE